MKKIIVSILVIGLLLTTFVASVNAYYGVNASKSVAPSADSIYVDDDNTQGPWDGTIEHPFQTIQDGVNASTNGDTVYVFNGAYVTTSIGKSINLVGEDRESTIVNGEIIVLTNWANISGFTIHNPDGWCGVHLESGRFCNISNNILDSTGNYGIFSSQDNLVSRNIISNSVYGVFASANNIIKENKIICNSFGLTVGSNNLISENNISFNSIYGLFVSGDNNNIMSNNIYSNGWSTQYSNGCGATVTHCKRNTISSNNFIKNKVNAEIYVKLSQKNTWDKNYWDDFKGLGPKRIRGTLFFVFFEYSEFERRIELPWVNFDRQPAREPHDIPDI
jgi:parallel beta-helix repeat protein